ncbi:DUF2207 domain-containing protein [Actinophytocola sp.]|uniref:DUF2207 domain-containing protein n=1 Tax=Actinophytocola sp. TaxID=1872138 RepID=UPI003D6A85BA
MSRRGWVLASLVTAGVVTVGVLASDPVSDDHRIARLQADVNVDDSGTVHVVETITYDFADQPGPGLARTLPAAGEIDGYGRRDFGLTGRHAFEISYSYRRLLVDMGDRLELYLDVVGTGGSCRSTGRWRTSTRPRRGRRGAVPAMSGPLRTARRPSRPRAASRSPTPTAGSTRVRR